MDEDASEVLEACLKGARQKACRDGRSIARAAVADIMRLMCLRTGGECLCDVSKTPFYMRIESFDATLGGRKS